MKGGVRKLSNNDELIMLVDYSRCIGCESCTAICKQTYNLSPNVFRTQIIERKIEQDNPDNSKGKARRIYYKNACLHCTEASCVMACPTGACHKNEYGLVVIDDSLCIGCNYCAKNCPFNAISFDKFHGVVEKCTLCAERFSRGEEPLCSTVCPEKAIRFGPKNKLLEYANKRVDNLKGKGYVNARLYGDCEYGGQRVMAILEEKPEAYGLPANPDIPLMLRLWDTAPIRPITLLAAALIVGFNFIHTRKYEKKAEEVREKHDEAPFCHVVPGQDEGDELEAMDEKSE